jgi:prepilin-type N-terminal cleavage/methylation domain-containing protein
MSNRKHQLSGFTLIELLVSLSIIIMITSIFLANYGSSNKRSDINATAQEVVTNFRLAQGYALGLSKYGTNVTSAVPTGGWGVHFDVSSNNNTSYIIFADVDANGLYSAGEADPSMGGRIITLPPNIIISSLSLDSIPVSPTADVTFLPPDPITTITASSGQKLNGKDLDIVLKNTQTQEIKTIQVNFLGLAEVLN